MEKLEMAIFAGDFTPGERLTEARLSSQLGVGRGPVREALRRLEGRKLVVREPNCGISVTKLSGSELKDLMELREILEVAACRLACERMTDEDLANLRRTLQRQSEVHANPLHRVYSQWHSYDFHYQIALASGNARLIELLCGDIWFRLRSYRYPGALSPGRLTFGQADHTAILNALETRDTDLCERLVRDHLRHFSEILLSGPEGKSDLRRKLANNRPALL